MSSIKKFLDQTGTGYLWSKIKTELDKKLEEVEAADDSIVITNDNEIAVAISSATGNALQLKTTAGEKGLYVPPATVPEYTIAALSSPGDYAAVYQLKKDGVAVGANINIPKDMVVQSGSVVTLSATDSAGHTAGTYIKILLQNTDDELWIPVDSLIEYVTSGSGENDMVQITVDGTTHEVTASIKAGSITTTELASGITSQLHTHSNATVLSGITSTKVSNWDSAYTNSHTHSNATVLNNLTQAVLDNSHSHSNKSVLDGISANNVTAWNAALQDSDVVALTSSEIDAAIAANNS